jgi:hypothetical protein
MNKPEFSVGDPVRIERDEYPTLVGVEGTVGLVSPDGTAVVVHPDSHPEPEFGMWCAVADLVLIDPE